MDNANPFYKEIYYKLRVLDQLGIKITQEIKGRLCLCKNITQLDNCARSIIINYEEEI